MVVLRVLAGTGRWRLVAGANKPLWVATKGEQSCGPSASSLLFLFVLVLLGLCSAGGFWSSWSACVDPFIFDWNKFQFLLDFFLSSLFFFFFFTKPKPQFCFRKVADFAMSLVLTQAVSQVPQSRTGGGWHLMSLSPFAGGWAGAAKPKTCSLASIPESWQRQCVCPASPLCTTGCASGALLNWSCPRVFKMRENQMLLLSVVLYNNLDFNTK